ncbi:winged helix-turn-helix transcriptional regulator [Microbacterium sulfonylureivorans]|uniref:winged helix-turn-helix transcriptional regulator n=1 Tax=Microbacterium sulfonylureivorans TaxID=2486854 RepID=UPI000FD876B6|nr:helix-turn-helix domain-containing protein [Microbacterium sulfonylureivorans]
MLGRMYDSQVCSIARSLEQIGERWSLLIVRDALFAGVTRFGDFQHNLGIATNVLASRLDSFVAAGVMERRGSADYVLTEKGRRLAIALIALTEWGDEFASEIEPPILYRHTACGGAVHAVSACETCGIIPSGQVEPQIGPGMPPEFLSTRRGSPERR